MAAANWGGPSYDSETHTLYVNSMDVGMLFRMVKRPEGSLVPYRNQGSGSPNSRFWDKDLNPCRKPPWGFLTAINLDTGDFRWRSVLGVVDEPARAKGDSANRDVESRRIAGDSGRAGV